MVLPVKLKTWNYSVNNLITELVAYDRAKAAVFQVKNSLVSFAQWSVVASSDSVAVKNIGDGSPDLWSDWTTDIVGGAGAHSWIILENSVTGGQLCIDMNSTVYYSPDWLYSATGSFNTDGTTSARPTDSESLFITDTVQFLYNTVSYGCVVNAMCSSDGKCTRVYIHQRNGADKGGFFFALEDLIGTPTLWTGTIHQAVLRMITNIFLSSTPVSQDPNINRFDSATAMNYIYQVGAGPYEGWNTAFATCEAYNQWSGNQGNGLQEVDVNLEWNEGYPAQQIGLFRDVVTRGGGMGAFQDLYWAPRNHQALTAYPDDGSNLWVKWGCFLVPWNGSVPLEVP